VTQEEARALYSEYLEDALDTATRDEMQMFLAKEPEAAAEMIGLERTLSLLHRLPAHEPSLDIWREFLPQVEAYRAERRLSLTDRLKLQWSLLLSQASAGVILWTHALAHRAHQHLGQHLQHEHLPPWEQSKERK
jgi:hypothetical protein